MWNFFGLAIARRLVKQGDAPVTVVGETFDKRAAEAQRAQALAKEKIVARPPVSAGRNFWRPAHRAQPHQQRHLLAVQSGCEGGRACLAPGSEDRAGERRSLLASDGFLALASDYGAYSADSLMAAAMDKGLEGVGRGIARHRSGRRGGDKFPRFKKSDDATAPACAGLGRDLRRGRSPRKGDGVSHFFPAMPDHIDGDV